MKNFNLFVVAAVATVAFASCGGGAKPEGGADSAKKDSAVVAPVQDTVKKDSAVVAPADTMKKEEVKK